MISVLPAPFDHLSFRQKGIYLDSAYTHPMSVEAGDAISAYVAMRRGESPEHETMVSDARDGALSSFARLHDCDVTSLSFVASTMAGENVVINGLDLPGRRVRVVTDAHHFFGSLVLYEHLRATGVEVVMAMPAAGESLFDAYDRLIMPGTALVAVSAVSATTGYVHDLKAICELAHSRGALVYADLIQAAGAIPLSLKETGVDFAASASYKWLMGDFGIGFFYCKPESLSRLARTQIGYRQASSFSTAYPPYGECSPTPDWPTSSELGTSTAAHVELGTQAHAAIVALGTSLPRVEAIGLASIHARRMALVNRLHDVLPTIGFTPAIPERDAIHRQSTIATFLHPDANKFKASLAVRRIRISLFPDRIRVSPSIFNSMDDIDALISALKV